MDRLLLKFVGFDASISDGVHHFLILFLSQLRLIKTLGNRNHTPCYEFYGFLMIIQEMHRMLQEFFIYFFLIVHVNPVRRQ